MIIECNKLEVEGNTDRELLINLYGTLYNKQEQLKMKIRSANGRGNIISHIKKVATESENIVENLCFMIDGDEGGFDQVYNELGLEHEVQKNPPYIVIQRNNYYIVVIVVGEKDNGYKGCLESVLNKLLQRPYEIKTEIDHIISLFRAKDVRLNYCDVEKIKFYLTIFMMSGNPANLYLNKQFIVEFLDLVGKDKVKEVLDEFLSLIRL